MSSCQRCDKTHSRPDAFLLTCRACRKNWHHRCLMPPMEDEDLIRLIRATNAQDTANDLSSWMCRRCKKHASATPSTVSSREQTASSESREDSRSLASTHSSVRDTPPTRATSAADACVKQGLSMAVDPRPVNDRERNKFERQESTEAQRFLVTKRARLPVATKPYVQQQPAGPNVQMTGGRPTRHAPQEKKPSPPTQSHLFMAARKSGSIVSTTSSEDDVEMQVDPPAFSQPASRASSCVSQVPASISSESVADAPPLVRAPSVANEQRQEAVRPENQPQINQGANEIYDDPDDLYGPPVERRIIRILPSLAEELREQQRRVAADKEKRRAPMAPDWILGRHANDPLWKEIPVSEGRKRRKATAKKLGDNGLNVSELMSYFTVENWVQERKNRM